MRSHFDLSLKLELDIWHEIASILSNERKNRALLSLATTSQALYAIALPALWRCMSYTLYPVVSSINSFAPKSDPFLVYTKPKGSQPFWTTSMPLPESPRLRIIQYLSYVRSYQCDYMINGREDARLWPVLSHWLGLEESLFPNLQYLLVTWDTLGPCEGPLLNALLSLLSPTIHSLTLKIHNGPGGPESVSRLLKKIETQGCHLVRFQFRGKACPDLQCAPVSFKGIQHLSMRTVPDAARVPISVSAVEFISSFPSLSSFSCDDLAFAAPSMPTTSTTFYHHSLEALSIQGSTPWAEQLLAGIRFPSLLELRIWVTHGRFHGKTFNRTLASHSPMIRSLDIRYSNFFEPFPSFTDLTPLFALPLESLDYRLSDSFTSSDFEALLTACPRLRKLKLFQNTTRHEAILVLGMTTQHRNLEELTMQIDTSSLFVPDALDTVLGQRLNSDIRGSRLEKLSFGGAGVIPPEPSVREILARNLVQLFPNITKVSALFQEHVAEDLERLISHIKNMQ